MTDRVAQPREGRGGLTPTAGPSVDGRWRWAARVLTWRRLKWASFAHSTVYLALLFSTFSGELEEVKPLLGWGHGVGWIAMSVGAITAARLRVIPVRLAVAIAVLGGIGPFFGTIEFVRLGRRSKPPHEAGTVESAWR
ncbi:MAG TPA: hypothetical protein VGV40_07520 [Solirubrobacteraceae bacterium]|nr:hypothetical protein [Solirubrobacteraceae bacterium]